MHVRGRMAPGLAGEVEAAARAWADAQGATQRPRGRRQRARTSRPLLTDAGMTGPPVRRAGRARLPDGRVLLWSVAEGGRGRRWRASTRDAEGRLLDDLLLEVDRGGRIGRLELTTAAGQLTFHADPDEREAHGNVVTPAGMRHVALRWAPGRGVEIPWSPIADAVLAGGHGAAGAAARRPHRRRPRPDAGDGRGGAPGRRALAGRRPRDQPGRGRRSRVPGRRGMAAGGPRSHAGLMRVLHMWTTPVENLWANRPAAARRSFKLVEKSVVRRRGARYVSRCSKGLSGPEAQPVILGSAASELDPDRIARSGSGEER